MFERTLRRLVFQLACLSEYLRKHGPNARPLEGGRAGGEVKLSRRWDFFIGG